MHMMCITVMTMCKLKKCVIKKGKQGERVSAKRPNSKVDLKQGTPVKLTKSNPRLYQPTERKENECQIPDMVHVIRLLYIMVIFVEFNKMCFSVLSNMHMRNSFCVKSIITRIPNSEELLNGKSLSIWQNEKPKHILIFLCIRKIQLDAVKMIYSCMHV